MIRRTALFLMSFLLTACSPDYGILPPEQTIIQQYQQDTAVEGDVWVDSMFQRQTTNGIDIIWIIDQSGSMNNDSDRIIAGIEAMLNALPESGWRLNIISTDPDSAFGYNLFPLIPGDSIDVLIALFADMQTLSDGDEKGFLALYNYIIYNEAADWWMREDAALLVVFVSDEEEQSTGDFPLVADFVEWFSGLKYPGSTFVASIVNLDAHESVCDPVPASGFVGTRYIDAANHYNGAVLDICSEDWSQGVQDAVADMDPYEEIYLTHAPDPDSVRVFLDGVDTTTGWYYDASINAVVFDVIPDGGVLIEVVYIIDEFSKNQSS